MKTVHCKHQNSCNKNSIDGFIESFKWTFIARYTLEKLFKLIMMFLKRKNKNVLSLFFGIDENKDIVKFAAIIGMMAATYKFALCLMRRILKGDKPDKIAAPVAGAISSLWLRLDSSPSRRQFLILWFISRLTDTLLNKLSSDAYVKGNEEKYQDH